MFSGVAGRFGVATHRMPPVRVPAEDPIWQRELRLRAAVLLETGFREQSAELSSDSSAFSVWGVLFFVKSAPARSTSRPAIYYNAMGGREGERAGADYLGNAPVA